MATADDEPGMKCPACLGAFTDPKVLPCCHTFCKSCLEGLPTAISESTKTIRCPQCREDHSVPVNRIEGFPNDFTITVDLNAANAVQSSGEKPPCGECDSGESAVTYCRDCQTYLCDYCSGGHKRMKRFKEHQVFPLESLTPEMFKQSRGNPTCLLHLNKVLVAFCKTCETLVCNDCIVTVAHEGHKYSAVDDTTREEVQTKLGEQLGRAKTKLTELRDDLTYIRKVDQEAGTQAVNLKNSINETFDSLISTLEARRTKLLQDADTKTSWDIQKVGSQRDLVEAAVSNLETSVGFTERALECTNDAEFLSLSPQALARLAHLEETKWESTTIGAIEQTTRMFINNQSSTKVSEIQRFGRISEKGTLKFHGLAKTYMLGSQRDFSVASERGFDIAKVVFRVTHGLSQKEVVLSATRKSRGKWTIPFTPVCSGRQTLSVTIDGKEMEGSPFEFTVQGTPVKSNRVRVGPDWPSDAPPLPQGHEFGTVAFSTKTPPGYIAVRWSSKDELQYVRWGADGMYDVELVSS